MLKISNSGNNTQQRHEKSYLLTNSFGFDKELFETIKELNFYINFT